MLVPQSHSSSRKLQICPIFSHLIIDNHAPVGQIITMFKMSLDPHRKTEKGKRAIQSLHSQSCLFSLFSVPDHSGGCSSLLCFADYCNPIGPVYDPVMQPTALPESSWMPRQEYKPHYVKLKPPQKIMIHFHNYSNLESKHPNPMIVHIKMNSLLYFTHPHSKYVLLWNTKGDI